MPATISAVEVYCLQDPQADFVHFEGSYQNVVVVVRADNDQYGFGESDSHPTAVREIIQSKPYNHLASDLSSLLIGETLDDPRRLWQLMYDKTRWYGRHGVVIHAISAVDIAIWDLFAKLQHKPLVELLGGAVRTELDTYATIYPMQSEPAGFEQQLGDCLAQGFKRIKICVEPWWQDVTLANKNLAAVRAFVGPEVELMLDVAAEFDQLAQLRPFIAQLEAQDFKWIEAPFDLNNLEDHKQLRQLTQIPVGVGDLGLTTCREFVPYLAGGALDIAQPDVTLVGGISETLKLLPRLKASGVRFIPHGYNTDITVATNMHLLCAQPEAEPLEYSTSVSMLRQRLLKDGPRVDSDGKVSLDLSKPGLGFELDWDIIRACKIP
ncbi:MAG: mandelate racemase/muconate lactonizing enzyme family protein [Pseudomonadales bacterium]